MTASSTDIWPPALSAFPMIETPQVLAVNDHEQGWVTPPEGVTDATMGAIELLRGRGYVLVDIGIAGNHGMFNMTNGLAYFGND